MNCSFVFPGHINLIFIDFYYLCIHPEFLKMVICPCFLFKDMDNDISVIKQYPVAVGSSLYPEGSDAFFGKLLFYKFCNSFYLGFAVSGTDYEIVGNNCKAG